MTVTFLSSMAFLRSLIEMSATFSDFSPAKAKADSERATAATNDSVRRRFIETVLSRNRVTCGQPCPARGAPAGWPSTARLGAGGGGCQTDYRHCVTL